MLKRFGDAGNPLRAMGVAGVCRLARMASTNPEMRLAVHEMALATNPTELALILGKQGQWDLVSTGYAKHVQDQHQGDVSGCHSWNLLSLMESGDVAGYRAAAGHLLDRFRRASDPNALNNAAWWCTLVPDAVADLTGPVQMAEAAVAGYPADRKRLALNTLGAALYRAGRIDEAIVRLVESVKASGATGIPQDWVYLAMAHH
jgi:hypothetical protein